MYLIDCMWVIVRFQLNIFFSVLPSPITIAPFLRLIHWKKTDLFTLRSLKLKQSNLDCYGKSEHSFIFST